MILEINPCFKTSVHQQKGPQPKLEAFLVSFAKDWNWGYYCS